MYGVRRLCVSSTTVKPFIFFTPVNSFGAAKSYLQTDVEAYGAGGLTRPRRRYIGKKYCEGCCVEVDLLTIVISSFGMMQIGYGILSTCRTTVFPYPAMHKSCNSGDNFIVEFDYFQELPRTL